MKAVYDFGNAPDSSRHPIWVHFGIAWISCITTQYECYRVHRVCVRHEIKPDPIALAAETVPTMTVTGVREGANDVDKRIMDATTEDEVRRILDEATAKP